MADTTQPGVSQDSAALTTEDNFQNLFDKGAFEPPKPEAAQGAAPQGDAPAPEAEAPAGAAEPEEPEYVSVEDFLAKQNLDADAFRSLPVTVKIDGQTKAVPLSEVLKSYQLEGHVNNKSIQLSEQQKAFEAEKAQAANYLRSQVTQAQQLGQLAQSELLSEYQRINWDGLKQADPAVWAAKQVEFSQRQAQINQHLQQASQLQAQEQQRTEQERLAQLPQERERLIQARPEWADAEKLKSDQTAMASYARQYGFTDAELSSVFDHRMMLVLHDAARYAQLQAAAPEAAKRVRAAPQMAKPGVRTNRDPAQAKIQQARERFQKNPRDEDAAADYFETLA